MLSGIMMVSYASFIGKKGLCGQMAILLLPFGPYHKGIERYTY